jgi:hypothetical protein
LTYSPGDEIAFSLKFGSPYLKGPDGIAGTVDDFSAADVFKVVFGGGAPVRWISAATLGLVPGDALVAGDELDALSCEDPHIVPALPPWGAAALAGFLLIAGLFAVWRRAQFGYSPPASVPSGCDLVSERRWKRKPKASRWIISRTTTTS